MNKAKSVQPDSHVWAHVWVCCICFILRMCLFTVYPWGNRVHPHRYKPVQAFTAGAVASHPRDVTVRRSVCSGRPRQLPEGWSVWTKGAGPHTLDRCANTYVTGDTFSPTETHCFKTPTQFSWQQEEGVVWKNESTDRRTFFCAWFIKEIDQP